MGLQYCNQNYVECGCLLAVDCWEVGCAVWWEVLPWSVILSCPDFCRVLWCVLIFQMSWSCVGGLFVGAFWCLRFVCVLSFSALGKRLCIHYIYLGGIALVHGASILLVYNVAIAIVFVKVHIRIMNQKRIIYFWPSLIIHSSNITYWNFIICTEIMRKKQVKVHHLCPLLELIDYSM